MIQNNLLRELALRIGPMGRASFPKFSSYLFRVASKSIAERNGVLLLGHTPSLAPEAYCHEINPPLDKKIIIKRLSVYKQVPKDLVVFMRIFNGASFFLGYGEHG